MLQIQLPFEQPEPEQRDISYRQRLIRLLKGNLDFHGRNVNMATHSWHSFPAKFPPQIPALFIKELTQPEDIVFDPMMGSCTTLLEAVTRNRYGVGTDIDPLSLNLSRAKLGIGNLDNIRGFSNDLIKKVQSRLDRKKDLLEANLKKRFDVKTKEFIDYWFAPQTQLELMALINEIEKIKDESIKSFLTLVFSSIIITKSGGVSLARDLAHTRPHRVLDKNRKPAIDEFKKRLSLILNKLVLFPQADSLIVKADSRYLPLMENSVDLIVTSPPYASNAIDYMRAHKFSLVWLGYPVSVLSKLRRTYIGGETISGFELLPLPDKSNRIVKTLESLDQKKGKVVHRYYSEMVLSLSEMFRIIKPGRAVVIVVGTSIIRGIDIKIGECLKEIGERQGFEHACTGIRNLDRDKRMMPSRWNSKNKAGIEARMHKEYVIGFIKPLQTKGS